MSNPMARPRAKRPAHANTRRETLEAAVGLGAQSGTYRITRQEVARAMNRSPERVTEDYRIPDLRQAVAREGIRRKIVPILIDAAKHGDQEARKAIDEILS